MMNSNTPNFVATIDKGNDFLMFAASHDADFSDLVLDGMRITNIYALPHLSEEETAKMVNAASVTHNVLKRLGHSLDVRIKTIDTLFSTEESFGQRVGG